MATQPDNGGRGGNHWRMAVWGGAGTLLLLPLVAMQFTREVAWDGADFVVFGAMLAVACGSYELATRMSGSTAYRAGAAIALAAAFALVWINLAVGIIGSEDHPANRMYAGVLAVGAIGAVLARFRSTGMAHALVATALAQVWVAVIALLVGWGWTFALTAVFVALWLVSAWLFHQAGRERSEGLGAAE